MENIALDMLQGQNYSAPIHLGQSATKMASNGNWLDRPGTSRLSGLLFGCCTLEHKIVYCATLYALDEAVALLLPRRARVSVLAEDARLATNTIIPWHYSDQTEQVHQAERKQRSKPGPLASPVKQV